MKNKAVKSENQMFEQWGIRLGQTIRLLGKMDPEANGLWLHNTSPEMLRALFLRNKELHSSFRSFAEMDNRMLRKMFFYWQLRAARRAKARGELFT